MFNHSHIRHFSSVFVSLRDFELITQNSSENIASRQSRYIYVNGPNPSRRSHNKKYTKTLLYVTKYLAKNSTVQSVIICTLACIIRTTIYHYIY